LAGPESIRYTVSELQDLARDIDFDISSGKTGLFYSGKVSSSVDALETWKVAGALRDGSAGSIFTDVDTGIPDLMKSDYGDSV
jgi:hypothetical protein